MKRTHAIVPLAVLGLFLAVGTAAADGLGAEWKFDVVYLKTAKVLEGLVVEETPAEVRFQVVRRHENRPIVLFYTVIARRDIEKLDVLTGKDHDELAARIQRLASGQLEDQRIKNLELKPAFWGAEKKEGLSYTSDHFELISNAEQGIVRRAAVRLEQIYAAYTHLLPPGAKTSKPKRTTTILLVQSIADYEAMLKSQGRDILNPAFYDATHNEIVCVSELQELGKQLDSLRREHEVELERIRKQEEEVAKLPRGEVRTRGEKQVADARQEIRLANKKNEELFRVATQQLFQTLYHEAFHAYLANFVYPPDTTTVPRWLNEGLAQYFELAVVDAGELRLGYRDPARIQRIKAALAKDELVPLSELIVSGPGQFVVAHGNDRRVADRHYLTAWALVHYLAFERKLLGPKAIQTYIAAVNRETDPRVALRELVGEDLDKFEKDFRQFYRSLETPR
jgi:hypothetical protein